MWLGDGEHLVLLLGSALCHQFCCVSITSILLLQYYLQTAFCLSWINLRCRTAFYLRSVDSVEAYFIVHPDDLSSVNLVRKPISYYVSMSTFRTPACIFCSFTGTTALMSACALVGTVLLVFIVSYATYLTHLSNNT